MNTVFHNRYLLVLLGIILGSCNYSYAQCITAFPYVQDFETTNGNWIAGGTGNDWAWGTPNKATISSAGQGLKCWIVGGLSNASYTNGERSYVQSPCFNFTNLAHPYIEFKLFWESEYKFDGANFQYSINNGATWINVGSKNDPVDCHNQNWFNYTNITYLTTLATVKEGWTGNSQSSSGNCQGGNGSNGWVLAKHCMSYLAGVPNVIFRFTFGAGTSCNGFDGVAFDEVKIMNAPLFAANFGKSCTAAATFQFTDSSTNCPNAWHYNFGDIASGAANTSVLQNPTHTFSGPGVYTVQFVSINSCSGNDTVTKLVSVLGLTADSINVSCPNGTNGLASILVIGANNSLIYSWSSFPLINNDSISNLAAGNYTVVVSENGTCPVSKTIHIQQPPAFTHSFNAVASQCASPTGSLSVNVAGGSPSYTYQWQSYPSITNSLSSIPAGNYLVTITDQHNCIDTAQMVVPQIPGGIIVSAINLQNPSCFGATNGAASIQVNGGVPNYSYSWSPSGSGATSSNLAAGNYTVIATDQNNCSAQTSFSLSQPNALSHSFTANPEICTGANGNVVLTMNGGSPNYTYTWQPNVSTSNIANGLVSGAYFITIHDSNNCIDTMNVNVANNPGNLSLTISSLHQVSCFGAANGSAIVTPSNGSPAYSYTWIPAVGVGNTATNLSPNNYIVQVTDANNCANQVNFTITQPFPLVINKTVHPTSCGAANGQIQVFPTGGNSPYYYNWFPNVSNNAQVANLTSGSYIVQVSDSNNCLIVDTTNIAPSSNLLIQTSSINDTCQKGIGSATVTVLNGSAPFSYLWSGIGSNQATVQHLLAGSSLMVYVSDALNCQDSALVTISAIGDFAIMLGQDQQICPNSNTPIQLHVNPIYQVQWQDGSTASNYMVNYPGTYFVKATNAFGCTASDTILMVEHCDDILLVPNSFTPNQDGIDDVFGSIATYPEDIIYYRMKIYNRWGQELFSATDYNTTWDGTLNGEMQPIGVYIYTLEYSFIKSPQHVYLKGDITLIR